MALVMPENSRKDRMKAFERQYIAHRGFYDNSTDSPENSMPAFEKAVGGGYGIELDVQLTKDKVLVVVHDYDLKRIAGTDRRVEDCTFEELKAYPLFQSGETVPALREVLYMVGGRTPLIIEIKVEREYRETCELLAAMLDDYHGAYCIESFSPLALWWFKRHRPEVLRGQLATNYRKEGIKTSWLLAEILTNCMLNGFCKPDFVAYNCLFARTFPVTVLRRLHKCKMVAWTIRSQKELEENKKQFDIFIFENFVPQKACG